MLLGAPSQRALEKNCFWTLSGRSPCGSRTVNSMVFACSTKCIPITFWLALGLLLASFCSAWALKWRQGSEKGPSPKILKNDLPKNRKKCPKHLSNRAGSNDNCEFFWAPASKMAPRSLQDVPGPQKSLTN